MSAGLDLTARGLGARAVRDVARIDDALGAIEASVQAVADFVGFGSGEAVVLSALRVWAGARTASGFTIKGDLNRAGTVEVRVSLSEDMSSPVFTDEVLAAASISSTTTYYPFTCVVTDLGASKTDYWYCVYVEGVAVMTPQRCRTAGTPGVAGDVRYAFGSCSSAWSVYRPEPIWRAIAEDDPDCLVHMGDMVYSDVRYDDPKIQRDTDSRAFRVNPFVRPMLTTVPVAYMYDDHDCGGGNDNDYDTVQPTGATTAGLIANTQMVIAETVPIYPTAAASVLSQSWIENRVKFVMPDLRRWRRRSLGTALGDGSDYGSEVSFDGKGWLEDQLDDAAGEGVKLVVLIISTSWAQNAHRSYLQDAPAEQAWLCELIRDCPVEVLLVFGDGHQSGADDGPNTDRSPDRDARFRSLTSSPLSQPASGLMTSLTMMWQGVSSVIAANSNQYLMLEVDDNGGDDVTWTATFKGNPVASDVATTLLTVASTDHVSEVAFDLPATAFWSSGAEIPILRQGFGACSVDYSSTEGDTGTITFGPNQGAASIAITDDGIPVTVTLSNPVGCTLGAVDEVEITFVAGMGARTAAVLNDYGALPSDTTWVDDIEALFAALEPYMGSISGMWALAAPEEGLTYINLANPGYGNLTEIGTVTYLADRHQVGNGSTGVLDTGLLCEDLFQVLGAGMALYCRNDVASNVSSMGADNLSLCPRGTSNVLRTRNSSNSTEEATANSVGTGWWAHMRPSTSFYRIYGNNGAPYGSDQAVAGSSVGSAPDTVRILGWQGNGVFQYSTRQVAWAMTFDGVLDDAAMLAVRDAVVAYLTARGANV